MEVSNSVPVCESKRSACAIILLLLQSGVSSTRNSNLTRGASIMVISVTLTKILGLIYIIPLSRLIGETGMGIYSNAYNLYIILSTLSTAGFPTAMGKLISERLALKKFGDVEQIYRVTMTVLSLLSIPLAALMWFGAPVYSHLIALKDPNESARYLTWSVRAVAPSLLVVPIISGLRGYLIGFQQLEAPAYSQAIEQIVRVVAIVAGAAMVIQWNKNDPLSGVASGAAAATFAAFLGALAALVLLLFAVAPVRREAKPVRDDGRTISSSTALKTLYHIALPISIGSLVLPIAGIIDSLTVQNLLTFKGLSFKDAISQYGILSQQAMKLAQLPMAFAMAIGSSILPAMAHANALRDHATVEQQVSGTMRSMFFMTFPVVAVLWILAVPIDRVLFRTTDGSGIIAGAALMGIFSSLELVSTYMLQGIGNMYRPVRNMFIGVFIKLILNLLFILPFGILGAAFATTLGYLVSSTLNILAVKKYGRMRLSFWGSAAPSLIATAFLCGSMAVTNWVAFHAAVHLISSDFWLRTLQLTASLVVGGVVYLVASIRLRAVSASELRRLPAIGHHLARLAERIQPQQSRMA